jgi:signal transduction histidine kinase
VEDSEDDALLVLAELKRGGYELQWQQVDTPGAMKTALLDGVWDLIISDYSMPHFSGLAALELAQASGLALPFIIISGKIGEETAVAAMKAGAHDYLLKGHLTRLVPVVRRELREAEAQREQKWAEKNLRENKYRLARALTELRESQQQVIQQERLSALGQMASGVAHDFNNALAKILGFSELLLTSPEKLNDPAAVKKCLQMVMTAAEDGANVVRRLRNFYRERHETEVFSPVNLNALVEQAVALTEPKWKQQAQTSGVTVSIRTELPEMPAIAGDASDLREVLTNLIFNAVDAMPKGGTITLATRQRGEQVVVLEVSDTGTGMTEEVRRRCLEPFFSTKGEGGTGLGLAIIYGIVQRHGGSVEIESELGKGTTFRMRLPVYTGQPVAAEEAKAETARVSLHVLVVDDEPLLRDIESEYLCIDGHTVDIAGDGSEALQKLRAGHFDLVITDRAMPQMNGDQLAAAIKQFTPETPVILVTGFGDLMRSNGEKPVGVDLIVPKPFTQETLRHAVEELTWN